LRDGINAREKIKQKAANIEKERKEEELRRLAQATREERAGIKPAAHEAAEVAERDQLRFERGKDRERERRIAAAAPDKRNALSRNRERDVSEQIALGKHAQKTCAFYNLRAPRSLRFGGHHHCVAVQSRKR
jgi:SNW domain-containing protein 1